MVMEQLLKLQSSQQEREAIGISQNAQQFLRYVMTGKESSFCSPKNLVDQYKT